LIEPLEDLLPLFGRDHEPELELRSLADEILGALDVGDARKLHDDAVGTLLLDEGLGHAELVDAPANDRDGTVHGAQRFGLAQAAAVDFELPVQSGPQVDTEREEP